MNFLKYQLPFLVWAIIVYVVSAIPFLQRFMYTPPGIEKIVHAVLFFVLCWLTWRLFYNQEGFPVMRGAALLGSFLFCLVFGFLDEYHHNFVSGRSADMNNVIANVGGAMLFVAISLLRRHKSAKDESEGS
ncbi:MAG TPA: VanZ family protein [Bacteroidota bacterium]|nr:VanZ family protein [Bacteroidota bacterium]